MSTKFVGIYCRYLQTACKTSMAGVPGTRVAGQAINCTLPPAAVVLMVTVCSAQKRYR